MRTQARLFLVWFFYTALLILATGAFRSQWVMLATIVFGSLFGLILPNLMTLLSERLKLSQLVYSYPFLFAFGLVAVYIVTSSSGWFGKALVLGMGLSLVSDLYLSNLDKAILHARWFATFRARLSAAEENIFVYGSMLAFVILTILALKI